MKSKLTDVVIVGYGRSAVAKSGKKGALRETHPVDLGGLVLRGVLDKIENLPDEAIDDIIVGCAQQEIGQTFNIGRLVAQRAGLPDSVGGMSCNRFCSSGLQTIAIAAAEIQAGIADVIVAGGVESMTAVPISYETMKKVIKKQRLPRMPVIWLLPLFHLTVLTRKAIPSFLTRIRGFAAVQPWNPWLLSSLVSKRMAL